MSSPVPVAPYIAAPPTKEPLDFADLALVDLQECATQEGRAKLAQQVRSAMSTVGFFYVVNHGYTQAQVIFETRFTTSLASS